MTSSRPLVQVKEVSKHFKVGRGRVLYALDKVSLEIYPGEVLGLVGESGCGKTTLGRTIIKLHEETSGKIIYQDEDISGPFNNAHRLKYSRKMQMIFQDPYSSLNPRMTVRDIIAEGPDAHHMWPRAERENKVAEWLMRVGLHPSHADRYPHEFSGGQRQRIGIARALATDPELVICDEPISALDVSVQAQIVNLLKELQENHELTYLLIAHDLSMVRLICDRMAVMYLGALAEIGTAAQVYDNPMHPYTKALIAANPLPDPEYERKRAHELIKGEIKSPINPTPGCRFVSRCPFAMEKCKSVTPPLIDMPDGRKVACHLMTH